MGFVGLSSSSSSSAFDVRDPLVSSHSTITDRVPVVEASHELQVWRD